MSSRWAAARSWIKPAFSLSVAVLLCLIVDVRAAAAALAQASPPHVVVAGGLYALIHAANAAKLRLIAPEQGFWPLLKLTLATQAYAFLLPGQLAVEAARAYRLGRSEIDGGERMGGGRAASLVAFDKLTGLAAVVGLTAAGLLLSASTPLDGAAWLGLAGLAAGLLLLGRLPVGQGIARLIARFRSGGAGPASRFAAAAERFAAAWRENARSPRRVLWSLAWGAAVQGLQVAGCWVLGLGLGLDVSPAAWCVVIGALTVALLVPITVAGVGVREASLIGLLGAYGVAVPDALAVALALLGFQLGFSLIGLALDHCAGRRRVAEK